MSHNPDAGRSRSPDEIAALLPHQYPFRFVDEVTRYEPGQRLEARFRPEPLRSMYGYTQTVPSTVMIEGLAQAAVLFVQLETKPLSPGEIPLLGKAEASVRREASWREPLLYDIRPIRMTCSQAILSGTMSGADGGVLATATLCVAVAEGAGDERSGP
ncbi:hypothetical protein QJ48_22190 [Paenibacillus sp. A3]|uniref:3-hydroxyacyl-ACP dehydratase FabZ family protein n=1 Tax=Paenibacillus sp. A3 TaxID=1337054 RepID=UPI0006D53B31|nr:hypothetical protein [Paenibacillus sp. A3]KPV57445.1 hypothetical protein QJ48_22190 [Paenibacillus sp. A3]